MSRILGGMTYIGNMMKLIVISKKERWNPATSSGEKRNEKIYSRSLFINTEKLKEEGPPQSSPKTGCVVILTLRPPYFIRTKEFLPTTETQQFRIKVSTDKYDLIAYQFF